MKSHALKSVVIGLYESLLRDYLYLDPLIHEELRSVQHLSRLMETRGLAVFTIALPTSRNTSREDFAMNVSQTLRRHVREGGLHLMRARSCFFASGNACSIWMACFFQSLVLMLSLDCDSYSS